MLRHFTHSLVLCGLWVSSVCLPNLAFALKVDEVAKQIAELKTLRSFVSVATLDLSHEDQEKIFGYFSEESLEQKNPFSARGNTLTYLDHPHVLSIGSDGKSIEYRNLIFRYDPKQNLVMQIQAIRKRVQQLPATSKSAMNLWPQLLLPEALAKSSASSKIQGTQEVDTAVMIGTSLSVIYKYQDVGNSYMDREAEDPEFFDPILANVKAQIGKGEKLKNIVCVPNAAGFGVVLIFADGKQTQLDVMKTRKGEFEAVIWTSKGEPKQMNAGAEAYWNYCRSKKAMKAQAIQKIREAQSPEGTR